VRVKEVKLAVPWITLFNLALLNRLNNKNNLFKYFELERLKRNTKIRIYTSCFPVNSGVACKHMFSFEEMNGPVFI